MADLGREFTRLTQLEPARDLLARADSLSPKTRVLLLSNLGQSYRLAGFLDQATAVAEMGLTSVAPAPPASTASGADPDASLFAMLAAAQAATASGAQDEALRLWESYLETARGVVAWDDHRWLRGQVGLAQTLSQKGEAGRARSILERWTDPTIAALGPLDPSSLVARRLLGWERLRTGDTADGMELLTALRDELESSERRAELWPSLAAIHNTIGVAHMQLGQLDGALSAHEADLAIAIEFQGATHPDTLTSRVNLAGMAVDAGQVGRALELLREVVEAPSDESVQALRIQAAAWAELGWLYDSSDRPDDSVAAALRALDLRAEALGPSDPYTAQSVGTAVTLMVRAGRLEEALTLDQDWRARLGDGVDAAMLARIELGLGLAHLRGGGFDEALTSLERARDLRLALGLQTASVDSMIGEARLRSGDVEGGLELLTGTLGVLERQRSLRYPEALEVLADYHDSVGDSGAAAGYRSRLEGR
ncbi:tetratricopeptide repeat protein [Engelhardtia mirabilis]|uniref:Tetratricopeptide repeat protein n=1 Tax=Engelhardtia mirabilis TaxID=2528011 RepID=A0A518BS25_9BACT|nr:Tetratricopeptide repeat protein [Planctomycetes bacterium Pla133]QDV04094.1 Tetratricopeptide repeat protein [Planctomycetes bacterium Pla86]